MSDRICIASNGAQNAHISAEDLVCKSFSFYPTSFMHHVFNEQHVVTLVALVVMVVSLKLPGPTTNVQVSSQVAIIIRTKVVNRTALLLAIISKFSNGINS